MTNETRKIVWRRQFTELSLRHPELVESIENQKVKLPLPADVADKYKTLSNYKIRGGDIEKNDI